MPATSPQFKTKVYGINQTKPFFTAGHVFHTTTGLRAIDPKISQIENDWLNVGILRVGDEVLRLPQDWDPSKAFSSMSYDVVTIETLPSELTASSHVYGLHLREGLRSYHANGFLVSLNYPELTVQRLVKPLYGLSLPKLKTYMEDMKKSENLISAALGHGVVNILSQRMKASNLLNLLAEIKILSGDIRKSRPVNTVNSLDLVRSFRLRPREAERSNKSTMNEYSLPEVTLVHGRVIIDGAICDRATINDVTIRWSRELGGGKYEHGLLKLDSTSFSARGSLLLVTDPNPSGLDKGTKILTAADPSQTTWSLIAGDSKIMKTAFDTSDDIFSILTKAMTTLRFPNTPPVVSTPGWEQSPWSITIGSVSIGGISESSASIPEFNALLQSIVASGSQRRIKAISDKNGYIMTSVIYDSVIYFTAVIYFTGNVLCAQFDVNMDWDRIELLRQNKAKQDGKPYVPTPGHLRFSTLYVENPDYLTLQGWYQVDPDAEVDIVNPSDRYSYGLLSSISATTEAALQAAKQAEVGRTASAKLAAAWPSIGPTLGDGPALVTELLSDDDEYSLGDLMNYTVWPATDVSVQQAAQNQLTSAVSLSPIDLATTDCKVAQNRRLKKDLRCSIILPTSILVCSVQSVQVLIWPFRLWQTRLSSPWATTWPKPIFARA